MFEYQLQKAESRGKKKKERKQFKKFSDKLLLESFSLVP